MTQARIRPPSFVLFGTRVDQLPMSYQRYLLNGIRNELGFGSGAGPADDAFAEKSLSGCDAE